MEERKQSLKRAGSQTSTLSRTPSVKWKDPVLSPTFHDVQIEQVQFVGPPLGQDTTTDKAPQAPERHSAGGRSSGGLRMVAPPPSEEGSLGTNNSEDRRAFRENYLYGPNERAPSRTPGISETKREAANETIKFQPDPGRASTVPLVNLPLDPSGTVIARDRVVPTRQESRQKSSIAEQRHRQKVAILRHLKRLQSSESPQQRRLMSGTTRKNRQRERYYEVAPGIILTELPPEEAQPQTAPGNEMEMLDEPIYELYERRARSVPHMTKSIIWTDKNRVASGRAGSSNSSKWRSEELSNMEQHRKANMFVKMPFKQSPAITMNPERQEEMIDDVVRPGDELRLTTAYTVSRVKKGFRRLEPPTENTNSKAGRLLKGRLKPLYPVKMNGPSINNCQGIRPEAQVVQKGEGYTPSPSRQRALKEQLNKVYEEHQSKRDEYDRRMIRVHSSASRESVHMTSPEPGNYDDLPDEDIILNDKTGLEDNFFMDEKSIAVANQLETMRLESQVIF